MTIDSHNPIIRNLNERDPVYNLTLDYKGYALSLYLGTPAEFCVFGPKNAPGDPGDRKDFTAKICEALGTGFIHCTAEGIRDVMNVIDRAERRGALEWYTEDIKAARRANYIAPLET